MITPKRAQTTQAVAAHYDELDGFYREIWGEHVHHGYWVTCKESVEQAVEALIDLLAARLNLAPGQEICDIGCGYGATAEYLAAHFGAHVTGFSVSAAQVAVAKKRTPAAGAVMFELRDWMANGLAGEIFDRAYSVESSEHMPDKQRFFDEAYRVLKPGGRLAICAWLAADAPRGWEIRHLLEPICREGRLPDMGDEADYRAMAGKAGFEVLEVTDISAQVSRTWGICARRFLRMAVTKPRYLRFLFNREEPNRIFALTLFRLMLAYRNKAMRYCVVTCRKAEA
jgi:tocopherol O-methyltransferase